jgi:hypothetical protein
MPNLPAAVMLAVGLIASTVNKDTMKRIDSNTNVKNTINGTITEKRLIDIIV